MSKVTLYGLKNCDTCKKALKALEAAGNTITFVDIRQEADLKAKIPAWLKATDADTLVNKRSTTWRGLTDTEKQRAESGDAAKLLITNPTLIKRPVIENGNDVLVGWSKIVSETLT